MSHILKDSQGQSSANSIGERAWNALCLQNIPLTPSNYEVFYGLFDGNNSDLIDRICQTRDSNQPLDAFYVDRLHQEFFTHQSDSAEVVASADELANVAASIAADITCDGDALRSYGTSLHHWRTRLQSGIGVDELLKTIAALNGETERAGERNRILEKRLSTSIGRVARLREDLQQVRQDAATDALTGLSNRRAFDSKLRRATKEATADPSVSLSLLMADVDHFKRFNDTYGHKTGDSVLKRVAQLLSDNIKGRDTAARFGGEEFAVLLVGADLSAARTVASQMCKRLSEQVLVKRGSNVSVGQVTISIGVAEYLPGDSGANLIEEADMALYEAKNGGRNRVCTAPMRRVASKT